MAAVGLLCWPHAWLEVCHGDQRWAVYPGGEGTRFALRWRHSVEQEDWIEQYRIENGKVLIAATRFKTFGAGVPAHAGTQTRLVDGWVVMSGIDRDVDPLTVQAAAAEQYRFRYAGGPWQRLSVGHEAPILVFRAVRASLFTMWPARLATWWRGVRRAT